MKSVMQEASSIAKAVEQAWAQAGYPTEFTVKVLEQPQRNFLGFTTRSAKVALFFEEPKKQPENQRPKRQPQREARRDVNTTREMREPREREGREPAQVRDLRQPREAREPREVRPSRDDQPREAGRQQREEREPREITGRQPREEREQREMRPARERREREMAHKPERDAAAHHEERQEAMWNDAMIETTKNWMRDTLDAMNMSHVVFNIEPNGMYLRIALHEQLVQEPDKERQLLASFATLILETLKKEFKTGLKGHKIILTHATAYEKHAS